MWPFLGLDEVSLSLSLCVLFVPQLRHPVTLNLQIRRLADDRAHIKYVVILPDVNPMIT